MKEIENVNLKTQDIQKHQEDSSVSTKERTIDELPLRTELVFILDKSGSMSGLEDDTIGGFNSMLKRQKEESGEAIVTTVLFDDHYELLHDRININSIAPITTKDYYVGGSTALLDAIGKTINKIVNVQKQIVPSHRADKVLFMITTDGMENASHEYTSTKIKQMIQNQTEKFNWEFIFLGANIDAIETAEKYGIRPDNAVNYCADSAGTELNYKAMSAVVSEFRSTGRINKKWKETVESDYENRGKI